MRNALPLLLMLTLAGCSYSVHQVHVSDFNPYKAFEQGEIVKASAEQFVVLGFVGQTDYVDQAYKKLMDKCPGGTVSGITTQISTAHNFFSWTNKALLQGLCIHTVAKNDTQTNSRKKPMRKTSSEE